jgi:hypothetical protein
LYGSAHPGKLSVCRASRLRCRRQRVGSQRVNTATIWPSLGLEIDRNEHASATSLVDRKSNALLCQDGQQLVGLEVATSDLEGKSNQREVSASWTARHLVTAGERSIDADHLLDDHGDSRGELLSQCSPQTSQSSAQVAFDRSMPRPVRDEHLNRNRSPPLEIHPHGAPDGRTKAGYGQPKAVRYESKPFSQLVSQGLPLDRCTLNG